jgi:hypothetical protein
MAGPLAGLTTSIVRTPSYKLGGVSQALGFNTFTPKKLNQGSLDADGKLIVSADAKIISMDFEENSCLYSDDTTIGVNRFPLHVLGFKLGGRTQELNDAGMTFDLVRTTWVIKTRSGAYLVLGLENGLIASQNKSGAGAAYEDFDGFDVVIGGGEITKAIIIDKATFDALAAKAV